MDYLDHYKGNFRKDADKRNGHGGWIIGRFMENHRQTQAVAVKYWEFKKGEEKKHTTKFELHAFECDLILEGKVKGHIDYKEIVLEKGDYVVIPPNVKSNLIQKVLSDRVKGLTIKAPSLSAEDSVKLPN